MSQSSRSTFGKYVLLRKLASGGMGEVFLAKQRGPSGFEKLLVIKRILSHHLDKRDYLDMFFSEAKLVARLNHNNIIQIQEMGEIDGDYYIAMEYVRGKSLRDVIDELRAEGKVLPLPHVVDLAIKLCEGLGYAHQARDIRGRPMNIVHRDINPHNVLVSYNGDLKLIDFGIAKSEMTSVHTATGTIKGKFVYMSPEQSAADPIDRRSDIFSLGIVLYEMMALENPFVRQNVVLSLEAIQRHAIPPPSTKRKDGGPLDAILARALEKRPEDRYQTAIEMRDDLRSLFRSGILEPAEEDVAAYLHDLFRADIDEEDRLLAEADRATTPPGSKSGENLVAVDVPSLAPYSDFPSHSSDEVSASPAHAAFGDEEPTLSADYETMARRSRAMSSSGRTPLPGQDPIVGPRLPVITDDTPPEIPTRSDRIPGAGGGRTVTRRQGDPSGEFATPTRPGRPARPPSNAALGGISSISPSFQGRPSQLDGSSPAPGLDRPILRPAAFVEPLSSSFLADPELDPSLSGNVFTPFPSRTPPDRPVDRDLAPRRSSTVGREDSGDLIQFAPPPPWRRAGYWAAGVVLFLATTMMGYAITRAVVPEAPRTDIDRIPSPPPHALTGKRSSHLEPTPDPEASTKFVGPPLPAPGAPAEREGVEAIPGVTLQKRAEPAKKKPEVAPTKPVDSVEAPAPSRTPIAKAPAATPATGEAEKAPEGRAAVEAAPPQDPDQLDPSPQPPTRAESEATAGDASAEASEARRPIVPVYQGGAKAEAPPPARLGTLALNTSSDVTVQLDGRPAGTSPAALTLKRTAGKIVLSSPSLGVTVDLAYEVTAEGLSLKLDASPAVTAKHDGVSLGKTPQRVEAANRHRFSLLLPEQDEPLLIAVDWAAAGDLPSGER